MKCEINLSDFLKDTNVLTSKDIFNSNININVDEYDAITIIIPDNIYSITPSFFEGLFAKYIKKLGRQGFLEKFTFISTFLFYDKSLQEAITRVIRRNEMATNKEPKKPIKTFSDVQSIINNKCDVIDGRENVIYNKEFLTFTLNDIINIIQSGNWIYIEY